MTVTYPTVPEASAAVGAPEGTPPPWHPIDDADAYR